MVRLAPIPGMERLGYELYHPTLRDHIRTDPAGIIGEQNALARAELGDLVLDWATLAPDHPARDYVLRHGPRTLIDEQPLGRPGAIAPRPRAGIVLPRGQDGGGACL